MKKMKLFSKLILPLLALVFAGCAAKVEDQTRIFWPAPPETPRLEWIKNYYSEDDFPKTGGQIFMEGLFGKPPLTFFARPMAVVGDGKGRIYVADPDQRVIRYFDLNNLTLNLLSRVVSFQRPSGLAIDSKSRLYVVDSDAAAVHVFDPNHKKLQSFGGSSYLKRPAKIAVNERLGRVYVTDGGGSKIVIFDAEGNFLSEFGSFGDAEGEFRAPQGIAVDKEDRVFVADQLNARIQVFDADGNFLYMFGERGDKIYNFEGPKDLAFDSDGNLHIVDVRKSALLTYTPDGTLLLYTGAGRASPKTLAFAVPTGISIDQNDRIYIADSFNMRVSVWQYLSEGYLKKNPLP